MQITINGEVIPSNIFEQERDRLHMDPNSPPYEELEELIRDTLIARTLIRQTARDKGFEISDESITKALDEMIEEAGGKERFHRQYGITDDQDQLVREEIETTLQVERLLDEIGKDAATPTDEDLRAYFKEHGDELIQPEEIEASHIVKEVCCEEEAGEAYKEMRRLRSEILDGADFASLAKEHSADAEQTEGGSLGRFRRGQMVPEFETIAFSMRVSEISPIFQTQFGYHVVTVTDRVEERPLTFEEAREQIERTLIHERKNDLIEEWVEAEKATAEIAIEEE